MGKYFVEITPDAKNDLTEHFKSGNKGIIKKIEKILLQLSETPYEGEGRPEQLKHDFSGYWSRRKPKGQDGLPCRRNRGNSICSFCNGPL